MYVTESGGPTGDVFKNDGRQKWVWLRGRPDLCQIPTFKTGYSETLRSRVTRRTVENRKKLYNQLDKTRKKTVSPRSEWTKGGGGISVLRSSLSPEVRVWMSSNLGRPGRYCTITCQDRRTFGTRPVPSVGEGSTDTTDISVPNILVG